jgi:phage shock protein E
MNLKLVGFAVIAIVLLVFFLTKGNDLQADKSIVSEKIKNGALVVDVRTVGEFQSGHFPNAVNIPIDQTSDRITEYGSDKNKDIILYCQSGARASSVKRMLEKAGFKNVINAGGISQMPR